VNGALNLLLGGGAAVGLAWLQMHDPLYPPDEGARLALVAVALGVWLLCAALQCWWPLRYWAAPAFAVWAFFALVPPALPLALVHNKMPDQFILAHRDALRSARTLVSDDVGTAAALAWRLARTDVVMLDTHGGTALRFVAARCAGALRHARRLPCLARAGAPQRPRGHRAAPRRRRRRNPCSQCCRLRPACTARAGS